MARPAALPPIPDEISDDELMVHPDILAAMAPRLIDDVNWLLDLAEDLTGVARAFFEPPQPGETFH